MAYVKKIYRDFQERMNEIVEELINLKGMSPECEGGISFDLGWAQALLMNKEYLPPEVIKEDLEWFERKLLSWKNSCC